jgi:hypothetical protein
MREKRGKPNQNRYLRVRAEPLDLAEAVCRRMANVVRVADGSLILDASPAWAEAIDTVLVSKGVRVGELVAL